MKISDKYICGYDPYAGDGHSAGAIVVFDRKNKVPVYVTRKLWKIKIMLFFLYLTGIKIIKEVQ